MASELALVATAVISSMAALTGVGLTWALGNISAESKDRRMEREAVRHRLEDKYVQVLADIDLYLRSQVGSDGLNERLALVGATVGVFAGQNVSARYNELADAIGKLEKLVGNEKRKSLSDYSGAHPLIWALVDRAQQNLISAMQEETKALRNFG